MLLDSPRPLPAALKRKQAQIVRDVRKLLWVLGTLGALSPFVGLFGTVVGIMRAFHEIGSTGQAGFDVVATGISAALISTAAGIAVALEAIVFFNYLQNRTALFAAVLRETTEELDEALASCKDHEQSRAS